MNNTFDGLKERMNKGIFPAVPIPFKKNGDIDKKAQESYMQYMKTQDVSGFSVWVHTGRGLLITEEQREYIMKSWREAFEDKIIIAGVGANINECLKYENPEEEYIRRSKDMALKAKELKADAILLYAPNIFKNKEDMEDKIINYHEEIAKLGLPIILFYLYEEAGGISYSKNLLRGLLSIDEVIGIKMATLDSVMTYQDTSEFIKKEFPDKMLITGEDRMFGYTLMCGAEGALVGLGAACTSLQKKMMDAYYNKDYSLFIELSNKVDKLAECTFTAPMEGYIKRMLTVLNLLGVIPKESTYDLFGPIQEIHSEEVDKIKAVLEEIGEL